MEGMSERAYAAHAGLSRGAVQKARRNGRLVLFADGSINAAASDAQRLRRDGGRALIDHADVLTSALDALRTNS